MNPSRRAFTVNDVAIERLSRRRKAVRRQRRSREAAQRPAVLRFPA